MRRATVILVAGTMLALLTVPALAQGPGWGRGQGQGGGWWSQVEPQTEQQKQFVDQAGKLYQQMGGPGMRGRGEGRGQRDGQRRGNGGQGYGLHRGNGGQGYGMRWGPRDGTGPRAGTRECPHGVR